MARILVVDDDSRIREVVTRMLIHAGHEVAAAENAVAALRLWHEQAADLVLTDLRLPDRSGFALIHELRTLSPSLPVVVASGDTGQSPEQLREAEQEGRVLVLKKPFRGAELLSMIATGLAPEE